MVPPVILGLESACAALGTPAAAVRTCAQQAGLGLAARQGVPVPTRGIATQRLDVAAVPLGGLASAASEVVSGGACPGPREGPGRPAQGDPGSLAACDSGHWGPDCGRPCNCSAGHGSCEATSGLCVCEAGYTGPRCEQRCTQGHFGPRCGQQCRCEHGAACDHVSGACTCLAGWRGTLCERGELGCGLGLGRGGRHPVTALPAACPGGFLGLDCHRARDCPAGAPCDAASCSCLFPAGRLGPRCAQSARGPCQPWGLQEGGPCTRPDSLWGPGLGVRNCQPALPTPTVITAARPAPVLTGPPVTLSMGSAAVSLAGWAPPACRVRHTQEGVLHEERVPLLRWVPHPERALQSVPSVLWGGCQRHYRCLHSGLCDPPACGPLLLPSQLAGWGSGEAGAAPVRWSAGRGGGCRHGGGVAVFGSAQPSRVRLSSPPVSPATACTKGTFGARCEGRCACRRGAACHHVTGACLCPPGWRGPRCENACPQGWFGEACAQRCQCPPGAACHHITGVCRCPPGFTGPSCEQTCLPGTFGDSCGQKCQCPGKNQACHPASGACACTAGYHGSDCQQRCPPGRFGPGCEQLCGCLNGGTCDAATGACRCPAGFLGADCSHACPQGRFGTGCTHLCGCGQGVPCDPVTGTCVCPPGRIGVRCERGCPQNRFGLGCEHVCLCRNGGLCRPADGSCSCRLGWMGLHCELACPLGRYGAGCHLDCSCHNDSTCEPATGACHCHPGFYGQACEHSCPPGFHGAGCQGVCECQHGAPCHPVSGQCLCPAGFQGQFCEQGCEPGSYGEGCSQRCDCEGGAPCDPVTGLCLCPPGRTGATCDLDCSGGSFGPGCALRCDCGGGADCDPISGQCHCVDGHMGPTCRHGESGSWPCTCVGAPCSPRACLRPRAQLPPDQPLANQRPGSAAGQRGTSSEAAPTKARPLSASTGTQGLWCSQGGQPWAGTPDPASSLGAVDSLTLQGLSGCDKRCPLARLCGALASGLDLGLQRAGVGPLPCEQALLVLDPGSVVLSPWTCKCGLVVLRQEYLWAADSWLPQEARWGLWAAVPCETQ
ncbi:hypothetical protein MC885_020313 [Smutsia gigantea]|nr:hypothetical protein MC885_020313 [Smutsia gigantea]